MLSGTNVFLLIHVGILAVLFALRLFGIAADIVLLGAAAAISLEAVCMALFTKKAASEACRTVKEIKTDMAGLKESASETVKLQRAILYTGHQIKTIQQELDFLKKKTEVKLNGNGHHKRSHHPVISHS